MNLSFQAITYLAKVRAQWSIMVSFFSHLANRAEITLGLSIEGFADMAEGLLFCDLFRSKLIVVEIVDSVKSQIALGLIMACGLFLVAYSSRKSVKNTDRHSRNPSH